VGATFSELIAAMGINPRSFYLFRLALERPRRGTRQFLTSHTG
jgi:hypothetical protein